MVRRGVSAQARSPVPSDPAFDPARMDLATRIGYVPDPKGETVDDRLPPAQWELARKLEPLTPEPFSPALPRTTPRHVSHASSSWAASTGRGRGGASMGIVVSLSSRCATRRVSHRLCALG